MQEDLDPFELMEAVNIIDRLPKDFFDKIVKLNHREIDHLIFRIFRNQNNGKIEKKCSMIYQHYSLKIQN